MDLLHWESEFYRTLVGQVSGQVYSFLRLPHWMAIQVMGIELDPETLRIKKYLMF